MNHYEFEISQFIDGELPQEEQNGLFAHLSECPECRLAFRDYMGIKKNSSNFYSALAVETPVLRIPEKKISHLTYYAAAAACFIMAGLLTFTYFNLSSARGEIGRLLTERSVHRPEIPVPEEKVVEYRTVEKIKYVIQRQPVASTVAADAKADNPDEKSGGYLKEIENLKSEIITENDVILSQN